MPRSHPPTLITLVARTLREEAGALAGVHVLAAVSGGADSVAMLHVLAGLRERLGFELSACGVDHGLRREAAGELELAALVADRVRVSWEVRRVSVGEGANLQARAREERYRALRDVARGRAAGLIATGHHADDRAETVLARILRGSGVRGLGVLPVRGGDLLRPLIRARRSDVLAHCERHDLPFAEDPTNRDPRFQRTRIRRELLPLLEELSPGAVTALNGLADECSQAPLPPILVDGEPLELGRQHALELRRALSTDNRRACIPLGGGRVIVLDPLTGEPVVVPDPRAE